MLLRRLTLSAASLLPPLAFSSAAYACFSVPGSTPTHATASGELGEIVQQTLIEFPLSDALGNDLTVGRLVYGVARSHEGSLDFFYQFFNYSPDDIGLKNVSMSGFSGVNAEMRTLAGWDEQDLPTAASRSADGGKISFLFDDFLLSPGDKTLTMVVHTDATTYNEHGRVELIPYLGSPPPLGAGSLIEAQLPAFAPAGQTVQAVPLPAPVWSTLAGLAVAVIYVIRSK